MFELARWSTRQTGEGEGRTMLELPLRVAGYDIDFGGMVNNAVYVRWLEDLRTIFMARWLRLEDAVARGESPVLVRIEVDYKAPLRLGDTVEGRVWVASLARASGVMESEIVRLSDGAICAAARQTFCWVDLKTGRPVRMPTEFRQAVD